MTAMHRVPTRLLRQFAVAMVLGLWLSACTIGLVPAYDADLAEGLAGTNRQALILFAEVEDGSTKDQLATHAKDYAEVIGSLEELGQRAAARPLPPLAARLQKQKIFQTFCNSESDPTACLNASPASIAEALATIRMMRKTHREMGLSPALVQGFQRQYVTAIRQALTVESALKR